MSSSTRRDWVALATGLVFGAGAGGLLRGTAARARRSALRPPGASSECEFLAACIRCGKCVQACPAHALELTGLEAGLAGGAPTFTPRSAPCTLCEGHADALCIRACPSGALKPLADLREARMGTARVEEALCWAHHGQVCRACWHACPYPDDAIRFDAQLRPVVVAEHCVGCGLCEHACPIEGPSAIVVHAPTAARPS